jgi:hypothetical protein
MNDRIDDDDIEMPLRHPSMSVAKYGFDALNESRFRELGARTWAHGRENPRAFLSMWCEFGEQEPCADTD